MSKEINKWLSSLEDYSFSDIQRINSDASFRNYFRVTDDRKGSFIVMDSDPSLENNEQFLYVADLLNLISMPIPNIHHIDDCGRYFLISDLGTKTLYDHRRENHFLDFYDRAIELLVTMQINSESLKIQLPNYDDALLYSEMELFKEWFCFHELGLSVQKIEKIDFDTLFMQLIQSASNQERVLVHRDYHSRNIMIADNDEMVIRILNGRGNALYYLEDYPKCVESYHKAMVINPKGVQGKTLYNMGTAYAEMQRFGDAIKCFEQAMPRGLDKDQQKLAKEQIRRCNILQKEQQRKMG